MKSPVVTTRRVCPTSRIEHLRLLEPALAIALEQGDGAVDWIGDREVERAAAEESGRR